MMPNAWASYREWDGKLLVYFSHMLSYRSSIKEIWYGIDKDVPDTKYKIAIMTPTGVVEHAKELDHGDPAKPHSIDEKRNALFRDSR